MAKLSFQSISHQYGKLPSVHDVSFTIGQGEVVSLLGPSGCGKSTLLRLAAGLEVPQSGEIHLNDELVSDPRFALPAEKRDIGLVFQNYALFPHLTVLENVEFGVSGQKQQVAERALAVLAEFDVIHLAEKYPHELSGGQQQRVALARAVAPSPKLVLLDEPFSGLDTRLRETIRDKMLHVLRDQNIAALMVTHDAEEAMFMSDKIVVLNKGVIAQTGRPLDVYCSPKTPFVASFFGEANQFSGIVKKGVVRTIIGDVAAPQFADGQAVEIVVRNESLTVYNEPQQGANQTAFTLLEMHLLGSSTIVHIAEAGKEHESYHLHAKIPGLNYFEIGATVYLSTKPEDVFIFPSNP
ncbi:MAG: ABC transporter ATP-binding protein [Candidatus Puniceispirillaceae bacterium]